MPAPPPQLSPVVGANQRSPYSLSSVSLPPDLAPIKPEVLFEAGNMVVDDTHFCDYHPAVSLLSTGADVETTPLVPCWATSAAAAMAGQFFGRLQAGLPNLWPETYRALAVQSAEWPTPIRSLFIGRGRHWKGNIMGKRQKLLRTYGYGVPDLNRALQSALNDVTLIAQQEIQPFIRSDDGQRAIYNEMHYYGLPWPKTALEELENETVIMKVTLSYFPEPNLSGRAMTKPDTYRAFGLRFAMKRLLETREDFRARVNASQDAEGEGGADESKGWLLGSRSVQAGSLHCNLWRGPAIELAAHDEIAVFPVGGWWKSHMGQNRMNDRGRYALIISISAPDHDVDLYTSIESLVAVRELQVLLG